MADHDTGADPQEQPVDHARRWWWAELLVASSFAIGQPLLDLLGSNPDYFLIRGASTGQIVGVALLFLLGPGLVAAVGAYAVSAVHRGAGVLVHHAALATFAALFFDQLLKKTLDLDGAVLVIGAALAGVALAVLRFRSASVRSVLHVASVAPLLFAALFFAGSPTSDLIFESDSVSVGDTIVGDPAPIVMLMFDEFPLATIMRDGEIDAANFPNFARLASQSTWFEHATGAAGSTVHAIPAILSGSPAPDRDSPPIVSTYPDSLFTFLGTSYEQRVYETLTAICPSDVCTDSTTRPEVSDRALVREVAAIYKDVISPADATTNAADRFVDVELGAPVDPANTDVDPSNHLRGRTARFDGFIEALGEPPTGPRLDLYHLLLPHTPFRAVDDGTSYPMVQIGFGPGGYATDGELYPRRILMLQHWEQARYTDSLLGRMIDRMVEAGTWDESIVAVIADHGTTFSNRWRVFNEDDASTLVFVPFFVKEPGQTEGRVVSGNVQTIDLLPTLAGLVGAPLPFDVAGIDALQESRSTDVRPWGPVTRQVEFTAEPYLDAMKAGLVAKIDPSAVDDGRITSIGPAPDLLGSSPPAGDVTAAGRASVPDVGLYRSPVEEGSAPIMIAGSLEFDPGGAQGVAIGINDRIVSTSDIYPVKEELRFAAMLDPEAFTVGEVPELSLWLIGDDGDLRPITLDG